MTRVGDDEMPQMFVPYHFFPIEMAAVAKTRRASDSVGREIMRAIESLDTRRPLHDLLPMRRYVERSMGDTRFAMLVLVCFAAASLLLAAVGVYGTLAYLTVALIAAAHPAWRAARIDRVTALR